MTIAMKNVLARALAPALLLSTIMLAGAVLPARAADPVFPTGSRLGLVPPPGMTPSQNFAGFEDPQVKAAILFNTLPAGAFEQLDKSMIPDAMKKQGIDVDRRDPIDLKIGKGFILSGKQAADSVRYRKWLMVAPAGDVTALVTAQVPEQDTTYTDKAIRDSLATLAIRGSVSDAERLSLLPFTIGDLAGFTIDDVLPQRALMLVDAPADQPKDSPVRTLNARLFIAAIQGGPTEPGDRENFARVSFGQIAGIKDVTVQDAEPLRIGNQSGYQTLAKAKEVQSDADVMVVQWLRFGSGGFLQMIGIGRANLWPDMFNRLRTVRDSIDLK
jgi:hypothetical protein